MGEVSTHWATCWREPDHRRCALALIDRLAEALRVLALDARDRDPHCPNMLEAEHVLASAHLDGESGVTSVQNEDAS